MDESGSIYSIRFHTVLGRGGDSPIEVGTLEVTNS